MWDKIVLIVLGVVILLFGIHITYTESVKVVYDNKDPTKLTEELWQSYYPIGLALMPIGAVMAGISGFALRNEFSHN